MPKEISPAQTMFATLKSRAADIIMAVKTGGGEVTDHQRARLDVIRQGVEQLETAIGRPAHELLRRINSIDAIALRYSAPIHDEQPPPPEVVAAHVADQATEAIESTPAPDDAAEDGEA